MRVCVASQSSRVLNFCNVCGHIPFAIPHPFIPQFYSILCWQHECKICINIDKTCFYMLPLLLCNNEFLNTSLFYAKFACLISFWLTPFIHTHTRSVSRQPWFQFIILNYICIVWKVFVLAFAKIHLKCIETEKKRNLQIFYRKRMHNALHTN